LGKKWCLLPKEGREGRPFYLEKEQKGEANILSITGEKEKGEKGKGAFWGKEKGLIPPSLSEKTTEKRGRERLVQSARKEKGGSAIDAGKGNYSLKSFFSR